MAGAPSPHLPGRLVVRETGPSHGATLMLTVLAMLAFAGNSAVVSVRIAGNGNRRASFTVVATVVGGSDAVVDRVSARRRVCRRRQLGLGARIVRPCGGVFLRLYQSACRDRCVAAVRAVQATMIGYGLWSGEHMTSLRQWVGLVMALLGLVGLLSPGLSANSPLSGAVDAGCRDRLGVYLRVRPGWNDDRCDRRQLCQGGADGAGIEPARTSGVVSGCRGRMVCGGLGRAGPQVSVMPSGTGRCQACVGQRGNRT